MYCRDCTGLEARRDHDGLVHHYCSYTGVTVCLLVIPQGADERDKASPHEADDPSTTCPRNLSKLTGSWYGRGLVRGVLRQVQERGELDALLATYDIDEANALQQVLASAGRGCRAAAGG